ncbi:hypothetical protein [Flavobacterium sp.]|uniref:hypothetical protein n=1 Tax=Flavobacterium sp. TaxID=239 RepID=UPI00286BE1F0|nr:hypothetical protein [Flavobacterium sp.]
MKKVFALFWLICFSNALAQKPVAVDTFALNADTFLGYDSLGAMYSVSENVLTKKTDKEIRQFKHPQLGKITRVDLQNPLKIVVFFGDFNTVILLDNQLNETQKIDLSDNNNSVLALGIGLASGNRLWLYNGLSQKIGLYDYTKKDFQKLTTPLAHTMVDYESDFNYFRWMDDEYHAFNCDVYGKIEALGTVPEYDQMQWVTDAVLLYKKGGELYRYEFVGNKSTLIEIDKKTFKKFTYKDQILSIFTDQGITNYKITVP